MKKTFATKYVRPTANNYGHTLILVNDVSIGYILTNTNPNRVLDCNWYFVSRSDTIKSFGASKRAKLIDEIKENIS